MAVSLDEQIMDLIVSKCATITTGNGYEQTVLSANIHRWDGLAPLEIESTDCPALFVRRLTKLVRTLLRGALEIVLDVQVIAVVSGSAPEVPEAIQDLLADVCKLIEANKRWNNGSINLARRSWIIEDVPHETETKEDLATGSVSFRIKAYADSANPFVAKAI